ncbi:MAG: ATP-binding protein [Thermoplasmata archaeon]|nr:ATP-binding protein [Thermoplasmata archaeon]
MFVGRKEEMEYLESMYRSSGYDLMVMYGRRRIGKTELLERFADGKRSVFFTARNSTPEKNISAFLEEIPRKYIVGRESLDQVLESVAQMAEDTADGRLLLVIDEFPYLANSVPGAASDLQIAIKERFEKLNIMIVLCGSSMGAMIDGVLGSKSPLYGRRTGTIPLQPLDYLEAREMLAGFTRDEALAIYGMVGGVPAYLQKFDSSKSLDANIADLFLRRLSPFQDEVEYLMREEMRNPRAYTAIIDAIAAGKTRISDISDAVKDSTALTSSRMEDLVKLGFVRRNTPYRGDSTKRTRYTLNDHYLRFHYAILEGHTVRNTDESRAAALKRIHGEMDPYLGRVFEDVCRTYCLNMLGCTEAGGWWGPDSKRKETAEIDIVGADTEAEEDILLFAECKYTNERVGLTELNTLRERSMLVKCEGRRYALFSASGFDERLVKVAEAEGVTLVTMDDLYPDG